MIDGGDEGVAYPLRIKLNYLKHLAGELGLSTTAPRSDLEVMVYGKLTEMDYDVENMQVVINSSQGGETLSLRTVDGIVLVVSIPSELPAMEPEEIDGEGDIPSLSLETRQLQTLLQLLEDEVLVLRAKLQDSEEEVRQLKQELSEARGKLVELWQQNCKQLLNHDEAMMSKETEIQLLKEQLQERELQLARQKLSRLAATAHSVSESKGGLSNFTAMEGPYQSKRDLCDAENAETSLLLQQGVVKKESEGKLPSTSLLSDSLVTKVMTSHVQSQHVFVTTTTSTSNNPLNKGITSKQTFVLTQPGSITSAVDSSQHHITMPNYPYTGIPKVQWSLPLQHSYDHEQTTSTHTSIPAPNNQQVTCVSSSLSDALSTGRPICSVGIGGTTVGEHSARRGKAPPIDLFTAESLEITFDDWLPTLERAATWNGWTSDEALMQLTGHLKGRALQEWKLLTPDHKASYQTAIKALKEKLDPGNQTLAALDFRHTAQKADESVSDFIGRLEQIFQTGFGREHLSHETRDMLLYGQLQEGLLYCLMESPAVSGAQNYKELCVAAKREERRLAELQRKQQYLKAQSMQESGHTKKFPPPGIGSRRAYRSNVNHRHTENKPDNVEVRKAKPLRCYICDSPEHLARDCRKKRTEAPSKSTTPSKSQKPPVSKMIRTASEPSGNQTGVRCVEVLIEGVPVTGLIDTESDITIIRGDLFYKIAAAAKLKMCSIKDVDQKVCTYDQKPIALDGRINMKITFGEKNIVTTVYVKLVAPDQLLLSESACHLLGIVSYHPDVQLLKRYQLQEQVAADGKNNLIIMAGATIDDAATMTTTATTATTSTTTTTTTKANMIPIQAGGSPMEKQTMPDKGHQLQQPLIVPQVDQASEPNKPVSGTVQVKLIKAVRLPAHCSAVVPVQAIGLSGLALLEPKECLENCLKTDESLVEVGENGSTTMLIVNHGKSTCHLKKNTELAQAVGAELLDKANMEQELSTIKQNVHTEQQETEMDPNPLRLLNVGLLPDNNVDSNERIMWRQQQLKKKILMQSRECLSQEEVSQLSELLIGYHEVFSLEEGE